MNLRTPLVASVAVLSALGGVAAAAIALPSSAPEPTAAAVAETATPEMRTKTIRRTIHVVRRDGTENSSATPARTAAPVRTAVATASPSSHSFDDSGHHRAGDDSGHHRGGDDDSGHHGGGDDDSGRGRGRGRGRGGDDD
jgi:hypothetical protein